MTAMASWQSTAGMSKPLVLGMCNLEQGLRLDVSCCQVHSDESGELRSRA